MVTWSVQRSGGRPLGRRHDDRGVETNMSMACVVYGIMCRRHTGAVCELLWGLSGEGDN